MKKLLALLLVLIIATLSVVSCGISKSDGSTNKGNGSSTGDKNNGDDDDDDDDSGKKPSSQKNKIAVAEESMGANFADCLTGIEVVMYETDALAAQALKKNKASYLFTDYLTALSVINEVSGLKIVEVALQEDYYGIGIDKSQANLKTQIDDILANKAIEIAAIRAKYINGEESEYVGVTSFAKDNSKPDGQLVVATSVYTPFVWREDGLFYGIDMEMAALIASELNLELVILEMQFDELITAVGNNGVDIAISAILITEQRLEFVDFSEPYFANPLVVVCRADDSSLTGITTAEDVLDVICKNSAKPSEPSDPEKPGEPEGPIDPGVIDPENPENPGDTEDPGDGKPGGDNPGEEGGESTEPTPSKPATADIVYQIIDDSYAIVTAYYGTESDIVIPSTYEGYPVKEINPNAFANNSYMKSVYIPASIERIHTYAFACCRNLESVVISGGSNLSLIDSSAFEYCESLDSINLRAATELEYIGDYAFRGCYALHDIYISASVEYLGSYVFYGCSSLKIVEFAPDFAYEYISAYAFAYSGLEDITIPACIEAIGQYAFYSCYYLESVSFEDGSELYQICDYAFSNADNLSSIPLPETLTYIGNAAFYDNDGISSIYIPAGVESIGSYAFQYCDALTTVTFAEYSVIKNIYEYAFAGCVYLKSVTFEDGCELRYIGRAAFEECNNLAEINLGDCAYLTTIDAYGFSYCTSLTSISLPASISGVGRYAFGSCQKLSTVYYGGSESDWSLITFDPGNGYITGADRFTITP